MKYLIDLLSIKDIQGRLERIFPEGLDTRANLVREMAAKVVFVFLYGGFIEGSDRYLRPSFIYRFTDLQGNKQSAKARLYWSENAAKSSFTVDGKAWYADTTREPIRDETIRNGLLEIGAVGRRDGVPTTSSKPIYFLKQDFAALFDVALVGAPLEKAIDAWGAKHLSGSARARMALLKNGKVSKSDSVIVRCPDGSNAKLAPGPSSVISKDVIEAFADKFLAAPALLWLSESGEKVRHQDQVAAQAMGLSFDSAKILPDIILASVGDSGDDTFLIFIEVVASDGPMSNGRRDALLEYVAKSSFPEEQCFFGTAFEDRNASAFKKCLPTLAWGTFVWFRSEPDCLLWLYDEPFKLG